MARAVHGIVCTDDGSFLLVSLEKALSGWRVRSSARWNADNAFRNRLLLNRGVIGAVPSRWIASGTNDAGLLGKCVASPGNGAFSSWADTAALSAFSTRLADNLCAIVSDDAYLCTIPLVYNSGTISSFVSVHRDGERYTIGVIDDKRLAAVFAVAPAEPASLERHLARIARYWREKFKETPPFPQHMYLFEKSDFQSDVGLTVVNLDCGGMGIDCTDAAVLAAAGAALCEGSDAAPRFPADTHKAAFRGARTSLYALSALLAACAILLSAGFFGSSVFMRWRQEHYKQEVEKVLSGTPDITSLMAKNDSMARAVISAYSAGLHTTRWAALLHSLGSDRPDGVFLDMLATEESADPGTVRMALSGWTANESLVTGFLSSLQKNGLCSEVTLASLEKNSERKIFTFRILCSFHLFAGSPAK